ncbi:MAG: YvrJ family protein [Synergistaceae bacterium]|jgi:hypothetical protein|nr:YvrJ family protein [Synergistaceae bacterium]
MEHFSSDAVQGAFSVAVAAYLLVRMESRLDGLTNAIVRLNAAIELLTRNAGGADGARRGNETV